MSEKTEITGEQVKEAVAAAEITRVDHHECSMCGYMTHYAIQDEDLYFCSGCECSPWSPAQPRTWDSVADWINMQTRDDIRADLLRQFGITENDEVHS